MNLPIFVYWYFLTNPVTLQRHNKDFDGMEKAYKKIEKQ